MATALTELEKKILNRVVQRFLDLKQATKFKELLDEFESPSAIDRLTSTMILERTSATNYLPSAIAFYYCGDAQVQAWARRGVRAVAHVLKNLVKEDRPNLDPVNIERLAREFDAGIDEKMTRVGLYVARDLGLLQGSGGRNDQQADVIPITINVYIYEKDPERLWDDFIRRYEAPVSLEVPNASPGFDTNQLKTDLNNIATTIPAVSESQGDAKQGEPSTAEEVADGDFVPLSRLRDFSLSRTTRRIFDFAAQIALKRNPQPQPVTSTTLLFAIIESGREGNALKTPHFLQTWVSGKDEQAYLASYKGFVAEAGSEHPTGSDLISLNVLGLVQQAVEIAKQTSRSSEIHSRHLLASLLLYKPSPTGRLRARTRLVRMGFDLPLLRKDFLSFLENVRSDNQGEWQRLLPVESRISVEAEEPLHSEVAGDSTSQQQEAELADSIEISSVSDVPAEKDSLGFKPYVDAISRFLLSPDTKPPLTLSIEGEWGSGKSSFMLQLRNSVVGDGLWASVRKAWSGDDFMDALMEGGGTSKASRLRQAIKRRRRFSVRFDPWRHDKEDSLWAAFALEFVRQMKGQRLLVRRWWGSARLFVAHYKWRRGWFEFIRAVGVWTVMLILVVALPLEVFLRRPHWADEILIVLSNELTSPQNDTKHSQPPPTAQDAIQEGPKLESHDKSKSDIDPVLGWLLLIGGNAAYFAVILTIWLKAKDLVGSPLEINLKKYLRSPDYEGRVGFVEQFHADFKKIVDAYAGKEKVFVFIDDLDRCEVPKAAELMKAVNLLIADDPRLIFILGMDREKVAAGLAVKYEKILPYLSPDGSTSDEPQAKWRAGLAFGQSFLQKFIQLPFRVPEPNPEKYEDFLRTISVPQESKPSGTRPTEHIQAVVELPATSMSATEIKESTSKVSTPSPAPPTPAEVQVRRERELQFGRDSEKVRDVASMFSKTLGRNPRRMKQFLNLFRLQAYIANEIGLFDTFSGEKRRPPLTLEQLGKFVAISLRWPALLTQFAEDPKLLEKLEGFAIDRPLPDWKRTEREDRWLREAQLLALLRYGTEEAGEGFLLTNFSVSFSTIYSLLHICPQRVRSPQSPPLEPRPAAAGEPLKPS